MKRYNLIIACLALSISTLSAKTILTLKSPGRVATSYELTDNGNGHMSATGITLPVDIVKTDKTDGNVTELKYVITANDKCWFNLKEIIELDGFKHDNCDFYMPGFWYHKNMRSPKEAPSFHTSDSWTVREDRLSSPLTGVYNPESGDAYTVLRMNNGSDDCVLQNLSGDVILTGNTSIGFTGFKNVDGHSALVFGYPYEETPKRYIRKLTLIDPIRTFVKLDKGKSVELKWQIRRSNAADYSEFIADVWNYTFDTMAPKPVETGLDAQKAKDYLSNFFTQSYVDNQDLKFFAGVGLRTADCNKRNEFEVGFIGRVLLNAFNALEYGRENNRTDITKMAESIFASVLENGFTPGGFFRESVTFNNNDNNVYSIRRQSEGAFAILNYLEADRKLGIRHTEWEVKLRKLLDTMLEMQLPDGSFPRKFNDNKNVVDESGGSTPSATLPLTMAYKYFKDKRYIESARATAKYLEKEIIGKGDYFSSTLDANCEDKEASLYTSTAMYYLSCITKGDERQHYLDMCRKSAFFCLSWYYLWDVPFASGQMLGDVGFKSRGWGNVSVENNHIDVFIFEFATVLDKLAQNYNDKRFSDFSSVIKTSMLQLMPREDGMFDIAKKGYYPEVVQHTTWDYGRNGKGFYNDIFAPGWTVASLWQMLSPERIDRYFAKK